MTEGLTPLSATARGRTWTAAGSTSGVARNEGEDSHGAASEHRLVLWPWPDPTSREGKQEGYDRAR
jgi:hypothetical protein